VNLKAADGLRFNRLPWDARASTWDGGEARPGGAAARDARRGGDAQRAVARRAVCGTLSTGMERCPERPEGGATADTRGETLGIYADVTADSLSFDGLRGASRPCRFGAA